VLAGSPGEISHLLNGIHPKTCGRNDPQTLKPWFIEIVDLAIENCDFPVRYINVYQRVKWLPSGNQMWQWKASINGGFLMGKSSTSEGFSSTPCSQDCSDIPYPKMVLYLG